MRTFAQRLPTRTNTELPSRFPLRYRRLFGFDPVHGCDLSGPHYSAVQACVSLEDTSAAGGLSVGQEPESISVWAAQK